MSAGYPRLLWLWGGLLAVLMILLFLPLSTGGRVLAVGLTAAGVAVGLVYVGRQQRERPADADWLVELPSAPYRLPIVLVCGDTADWPGEGAVYRTAQGCWLRVATAALQQTVRYVRNERPALIAQLAVMFCMQPQQHDDDAALAARLRELRWQLAQVRGDTRREILLLLNSSLSGASLEPLWQTARAGETLQVWLPDGVPCSSASWLMQADGAHRLAAQLRINALARFTQQMALNVLAAASDDVPRSLRRSYCIISRQPGRLPWRIIYGSVGCLSILPSTHYRAGYRKLLQKRGNCRISFCRYCRRAAAPRRKAVLCGGHSVCSPSRP